jgi:hypothetical protein
MAMAATRPHRRAVGVAAWLVFPEDSVPPAPVQPGYRYATAGFEEIDALGGSRHEYPAVTSITVRRSPCGRLLEWRPLRARSLAYEVCDRQLRSIRDVHRFFGRRERRVYRCAAGSSLRRGWRCTLDGTTEVARGGIVGTERIGGVETVHVRLTTRLTGDVEGTGTRDFWLRPDGIPVRLAATNESSTRSVVGRVRYRERYELELR